MPPPIATSLEHRVTAGSHIQHQPERERGRSRSTPSFTLRVSVGQATLMRPPEVAFIAPREVCRMANDVFRGGGIESLIPRVSSRGAMKATFVAGASTLATLQKTSLPKLDPRRSRCVTMPRVGITTFSPDNNTFPGGTAPCRTTC